MGAESYRCEDMVPLKFKCFSKSFRRSVVDHRALERLVELHHEPVAEVIRYASAVFGRITDDGLLLRQHLDVRTFVVGIHYHT